MKNSTSTIFRKLIFPFAFILTALVTTGQTYTTAVGDWTTEWSNNSGTYQYSSPNAPALYSFGTTATDGQVSSRNFTSDGTTTGSLTAMKVGQKLIITVQAPVGGGRSGIQSGGRIGFALNNTTSFYSGANAQARYFSDAMLRYEYEGGQSAAQLVDGTGTTRTGLPGFTDFVNGLTYEVEVISDKEYNFQVVGGTRINIRSFASTGTLQQITITDLGENRDAVFSDFEIADLSTVGLTANTGENFTVAGVISNKSTPNTVTKYGAGTVVLTGNSTYTGITYVNEGTLQLNASSANTIRSGAAVSISSGATLKVSQDQTLTNLTVPAGATLVVDAGKTLTITGIFTGGGTIENNGTIVMGGSLPQSFPGNGTINAMNNLTLFNNSVTLNNALLNVTGTLTFQQKAGSPSILNTGANVITAASVSGGGATNGWVNGNLARNITATGSTVYDIGTSSSYLPFTLNVSSLATSGAVQVSTSTPLSSATGYSSLSLGTTNTVNRVWSLALPTGSSFSGSYTSTATFLAADVVGSPNWSDIRQGMYDGSSWSYGKDVSQSGYELTSSEAFSMSGAEQLVFGSSQSVSISGIAGTDKVYDATTDATLDFSSAQANGLLNGDVVTVVNDDATGSFSDKHVGTGKTVTITGSAALSGAQSGAYTISSMQSSTTADITARPLDITAAANTKQYDGTVSAAAIPDVTSGSVQGSDVANFSEAYDTPGAGTNKTLTPSGSVNDGNSGNNYTYNFIASSNGTITNIPITDLSATPGSILCSGGSTTLTVSASGGDGQLQYSLSGPVNYPNQVSNVFSGIIAGTYTLTVTDEDNFSEQLSDIVVTEPQTMTANVSVQDESVCAVTPDGSITVTPVGGSAPYTYSWTGVVGPGNPATTPYTGGTNSASITDLQFGFYNVNIEDANGCNINVTDIHVKKMHLPVITHNGEISSSCGNTGTLIIYAAAGVAPYTYSVDGVNYQASNLFTGLAAGSITIYVKDAGGCIGTQAYTIGQAQPITINPYVQHASSCSNDGMITVYRSGGIPPYEYSIDGSNYQVSNAFDNLSAGDYTVHVRDSKGCDYTSLVTINQGSGVTVSFRKSDVNSCIFNDGTVQLVASGGVTPYTYSLDGVNFQASHSFTGLTAGNYTGTVKDFKGCTGSVNITINTNYINLNPTVISASSCSATDGSVRIYHTGGQGPFTYSMDGNNYQASNVFTNLAAGIYDIYVKDSKTCVGTDQVTVGPSCPRAPIARHSNLNQLQSDLNVHAFPNPSSNEFTISMSGFNRDQKVQVSVTDVLGRRVAQFETMANGQIRLGKQLHRGMYHVQLIQGTLRENVTVVKE